MANVANGDLVQVTLKAQDAFSVMENVRHYKVSDVSGGGISIATFLSTVNTAWTTDYKAIISDQVALVEYSGLKITAAGAPLTDLEYSISGLPTPGDMAGDQMPAFTAAVISLRTGTAGRRNRGRFYVFPAAESANDGGGALTAGYITDVQTFAAHLTQIFTITSGGDSAKFTPVVLSRVGLTQLQINNTIVRLGWGTQRRRKIGRGQ